MYHFYDVVINDSTGVPLPGIVVRVYDDNNTIVPLFADFEGNTPIESISGVANAAVTDDAGNYDFYIADGTYQIKFFVGDATLKVLPNIAMVSAVEGGLFIQSGAGATLRTGQGKARDLVSLKDFGAVGDNVTTDTASIQAALNAGSAATFGPNGNYLVGSLTMPTQAGFEIGGEGRGTNFIQTGGTVIQWPATVGENSFLIQTIRDVQFSCENGTNHTVNTTYNGNTNLRGLRFSNTPVGYANIFVNGIPTDYTHDIRIYDTEILSSTEGDAGILIGPYSADVEIDNYTFNGTFNVNYALKIQAGAGSIYLRNSHIYNAKLNILYADGLTDPLVISDVCFDNALFDLVYLRNCNGTILSDCRFQQIQVGQYGITLDNCHGTVIDNPRFDGVAGAAGCIREINGSTGTVVLGGHVATPANFTLPFPGSVTVRHNNAKNPLGYPVGFSGSTSGTASPSASTQYLGINGLQNSPEKTVHLFPHAGRLNTLVVKSTATPGGGFTYGFTVYLDGVNIGSGSIANGSFSATIGLNGAAVQGSEVYIAVTVPVGANAAGFRYTVVGEG